MTIKSHHTDKLHGLARKYAGLTVGLYGGSFNPCHAGHGHVAKEAIKRLKVDSLWMMVSPGNPLKEKSGDMAPMKDRVNSLRPHIHDPKIIISTIENDLGTKYTIDTIEKLIKIMPLTKFIWIMGADSLATFHHWKDWQKIAQKLPIAIFDRPSYSMAGLASKFACKFKRFRVPLNRLCTARTKAEMPRWSFVTIPRHPATATDIRQQHHQTHQKDWWLKHK